MELSKLIVTCIAKIAFGAVLDQIYNIHPLINDEKSGTRRLDTLPLHYQIFVQYCDALLIGDCIL